MFRQVLAHPCAARPPPQLSSSTTRSSLTLPLPQLNNPFIGAYVPLIGRITNKATADLAEISSPVLPMLATMLLAFSVSSYVFAVYSMAIDTILLCYCEDLQINNAKTGYFMSEGLQKCIAAGSVDVDKNTQAQNEKLAAAAYKRAGMKQMDRCVIVQLECLDEAWTGVL
jgi:hypothetical protein